MSKPRTYVDLVLLAEIEKALRAGRRDILAALENVREVSCLPPDPRVARVLNNREAA